MALVIPLEIQGNNEFTDAFRGMRDAVKEFRDELAQLRRALGRPLPRTAVQSVPAANQITQISQAAQQARGPVAQLQRAYQALQAAKASNDPGQLFDAQYAHHLAQNRVGRAQRAMQPRTMWTALREAVMTSRIGIGGNAMPNLMPLVNRVLPAIARLGPIGAAIAIAVGALVAIPAAVVKLVAALDKVTLQQRALVQARYGAGATYGQTYQMQVLGGAVGTDASGVAQAARQFGEMLGKGGWAAGVWRQYGVADIQGPYGAVNKYTNLDKALRVLLELPERDAIRLARESGLEQFLPLRDASPGRVAAMLDAQKNLVTPESARAAADFQLELTRLKTEFQLIIPYLTPVVTWVADLLKQLREWGGVAAHAVRALYSWRNMLVNLFEAMFDLSRLNFLGAFRNLKEAFGEAQNYGSAARAAYDAWRNLDKGPSNAQAKRDAENAARDRNTEAINENTRELRNVREILGSGGPRARAALPAGWRYQMLNKQLDALSTQLGGL